MNYQVRIDGRWTEQSEMFNRGDMSFYGFSRLDVRPPLNYFLDFGTDGEPAFLFMITS